MSFEIQSFDTIVQNMVSWIVSQSPQISDLTPGSIIRSFCEGAGLCIEELYVAIYLGFRRYLDNIQETVFDFERKGGVKASVNLIFSRTGVTGTINIPDGTECKTVAGLSFYTTVAGTIDDGNTDSDPIAAAAEEVGITYNVAGSSIVVMVDDVDGVETVDNANAATGGVDAESDYQYKQRFQEYIEGMGKSNISGLIAGALSVEGITSASVLEHFPADGDDVNAHIYIDDGSAGGVTADMITDVQDLIDGDGTTESPGYRSAGVNVVVAKPTAITTNVEAAIAVITGVDQDQVETDINTVLTTYINNLGIGADIIYNQLVSVIMGVYGVSDVTLTAPAANVVITTAQVGRIGTVTITFV
jgi:uncharacterized phage protein gp47/JayE